MSIDADIRTVRAEGPVAAQFEASPELDAPRPTFDWRNALIMAVGGLLTGSLVAAALSVATRPGEDHQLQRIAKDELSAASLSLVPAQAATLTEQAEACRVPLASLIVRATGSLKGSIRFRSGPYMSPNIRLGPQPDRIALPYPTPYATGRGQIAVESNVDGADVFLAPGIHIGTGQRSTVIDVRWNPNAPC